jgi:hypothetical protein
MKLVPLLVTGILLLVANVDGLAAEAKPKAKPTAPITVEQAKDVLVCDLITLKTVGEVNGGFLMKYFAAVHLACANNGSKPVRIKASEVFIADAFSDAHPAERRRVHFDEAFANLDPGPDFVRDFVDIAPRTTREFGFTFWDVPSAAEYLTLDLAGVKYKK